MASPSLPISLHNPPLTSLSPTTPTSNRPI